MKKILFLSLVAILFSCSSEDDNNKNQITPPAWIQGTWGYSDSLAYKFKSNDFCNMILNIEYCTAETIELSSKAGFTTNVEQTITDAEYKLSYTSANTTVTYRFIKISATKIKDVSISEDGAVLTKQ